MSRHGLDFQAEFDRLKTLDVFNGGRKLRLVKLRRVFENDGPSAGGVYYPSGGFIDLSPGRTATPEKIICVILHELCHAWMDRNTALRENVHHGPKFRRLLREAVSEEFGFDTSTVEAVEIPGQRVGHIKTYILDDALAKAAARSNRHKLS